MLGEVKILKEEADSLEIEILEGDEGLGEVLVKYLDKEKDVEFAAYKREHPFDRFIKVIVKSKKEPKKLFLNAVKKIKKEIEELNKHLSKV